MEVWSNPKWLWKQNQLLKLLYLNFIVITCEEYNACYITKIKKEKELKSEKKLNI